MTVRGQSKVNIEITGSEEPLRKIDKMINKVIICILISALLISSSLICGNQLYIERFGIPFIGLVGFILALFLSIFLFFNILNKKF